MIWSSQLDALAVGERVFVERDVRQNRCGVELHCDSEALAHPVSEALRASVSEARRASRIEPCDHDHSASVNS
jgi:hypothetical protein